MRRALFIVDVQNDFTEGGALGVLGGKAVASGVSQLVHEHPGFYDVVIASRDWHNADDDNGGHFAGDEAPDFVTTWPVHCVAGSSGADYDPGLDTALVDVHVTKGMGVPAYSLFEGVTSDETGVDDVLISRGVTDIDVAGIATDHCVRASVLDALRSGRRVRVLTDLVAGVAVDASSAALTEMQDAGATLTPSSSVMSTPSGLSTGTS